jgi:predicted XRE-type DNA-binding protein
MTNLDTTYLPTSLQHRFSLYPLHRRGSVHRFWRTVQRCAHLEPCPTCCWPWQGCRDKEGYGRSKYLFADGHYEVYVHRIAWCLCFQRPFPAEKESCHTCDLRHCCNAWHVREGTHQENMHERAERGPRSQRIGEQSQNAKLTDALVQEVWRLHLIQRWTQREIADRMHVTQPLIHGILTGKTWTHIPVPILTDPT